VGGLLLFLRLGSTRFGTTCFAVWRGHNHIGLRGARGGFLDLWDHTLLTCLKSCGDSLALGRGR
jgi:hypothetical protein